jgi:hypothetical protein
LKWSEGILDTIAVEQTEVVVEPMRVAVMVPYTVVKGWVQVSVIRSLDIARSVAKEKMLAGEVVTAALIPSAKEFVKATVESENVG